MFENLAFDGGVLNVWHLECVDGTSNLVQVFGYWS